MEFFFLGGVHKVPLPHRDMKDRLFRLNGFFPELKGSGIKSRILSKTPYFGQEQRRRRNMTCIARGLAARPTDGAGIGLLDQIPWGEVLKIPKGRIPSHYLVIVPFFISFGRKKAKPLVERKEQQGKCAWGEMNRVPAIYLSSFTWINYLSY